jgi:Mesyanzhinovviridae bifunctional DNA primase/polymerase
VASEPKPLRVPGARQAGYSIDKANARKPPVFAWNCPADVVIVTERLKQCTVNPDNVAGDVDGLIRYGRDMGISPNKIFQMLKETFPILANDAGAMRNVWIQVLTLYCDLPGLPGMSATGGDAAEQVSDGAWSIAYDQTEFRVLGDWQWITDSKQFIHDDGQRMMDKDQFEMQFGYLSPKTALLSALKKRDVPLKRFAGQVYIPKAAAVIQHQGRTVFNIWRPSGMTPKAGDHQWLLDHVAIMFPGDQLSQGYMLDYMAQLVAHPDVKIHFALLIQSVEGVGKGALAQVLKRIIGDRNVVEPAVSEFTSTFTSWQEGAQLAIVNELMVDGRREVADRLKSPITDPTLRIHKKFGNEFTIPNHLNFFAMTNHRDSLPLSETDRRWLVLFSQATPQPRTYYDRLFANIADDSKVAAVMAYLLGRKIGFNPKGPAPFTEAKAEMQKLAKSDITLDLQAAYDAGHPGGRH